jgi:hypothetical protein
VPRSANELPPEVAAQLAEARRAHDALVEEADQQFKRLVVAALEHGSVRQVAAAAQVSPTTVMAWSKATE